MMISKVCLEQGNVKKSKKLTKVVNIEEESLHILGRSFELNFQKKCDLW